MFNPKAVVVPPKPWGPIPSLLIAVNSSLSSFAIFSSLLNSPSSLKSAFLAIWAHLSTVPPIPTPITIGGHGLGPASETVSIMNFLIPSNPSDGFNIFILLIFSLPNPLAANSILILSPFTIS